MVSEGINLTFSDESQGQEIVGLSIDEFINLAVEVT